MTLHHETFGYLKPNDEQMDAMEDMRSAFRTLAAAIGEILPEGPDKTYILRTLRTAAMWANVAITRYPDGAPRDGSRPEPPDYPPGHSAPGDLGSTPL
jgi:hypothetical protein